MSTPVKPFTSYDAQVTQLIRRGMDVGERSDAIEQLRQVSYYRLSGYWYSFRQLTREGRADDFYEGTTLRDVMSLYEFDSRLRMSVLDALAPLELRARALLGHALGEVDECAHLKPELLSARASQGDAYETWRRKYSNGLKGSYEDFVVHHTKDDRQLPVWVAVEMLDWGSLRYLYGFSPRTVQEQVASSFGLRSPQFESWMKCFEIIRNASAHHGRLFNRVYTKTPKLPSPGMYPDLDKAMPTSQRTYGQLTLIQHLRCEGGFGPSRMLSKVLSTYPAVKLVPISHVGVPVDWHESPLWAT